MTLEQARGKARYWIELVRKGLDPRLQEERARREELRKQQTTFEAVAEDFIERHVKGQRRARDTEREIRKELISQVALQADFRNRSR